MELENIFKEEDGNTQSDTEKFWIDIEDGIAEETVDPSPPQKEASLIHEDSPQTDITQIYLKEIGRNPLLTRDERVDGAVMAFIGIDSIKDAARLREILQQEQRLALVVRNSSDAVILQDFTGSIQAWNHRATELYGYSELEALSLDAEDLIAPDDRASMELIFERLKSGQEIPPCESHRKAQDGHIFKVWMTVSALIDEKGEAFSIVITEKGVI